MSKELKLQLYKVRLYLLENKNDVRNENIIKKLKRRISLLEEKSSLA